MIKLIIFSSLLFNLTACSTVVTEVDKNVETDKKVAEQIKPVKKQIYSGYKQESKTSSVPPIVQLRSQISHETQVPVRHNKTPTTAQQIIRQKSQVAEKRKVKNRQARSVSQKNRKIKRINSSISAKQKITRGQATWYSVKEHGKKTVSGSVYDLYGMTAAHATLPLLTRVKVKNVRTGRSVIVTINDRLSGENVLIKLSYHAARKLNLLKKRNQTVEMRVLGIRN